MFSTATHKNPSLCRVCPSWPFVKLDVAAFLCQGHVREAFWCLDHVFKSVEYSATLFLVTLVGNTKDFNMLVAKSFRKFSCFCWWHGSRACFRASPEMFCISPLVFFCIMAYPVTVVWPHLGSYMAHLCSRKILLSTTLIQPAEGIGYGLLVFSSLSAEQHRLKFLRFNHWCQNSFAACLFPLKVDFSMYFFWEKPMFGIAFSA